MSILSMQGDLLKRTDVDAIINTVNCVGVMGKGIALQFKKKWPANFKAYATACKSGLVKTGTMFIFDLGTLAVPKYIINFPTKNHWRGKSQIEFIKDGLVDLVEQIIVLNINSIAMPPLGCGNGGLDWQQVKPLIEQAFVAIPEVKVLLFEPSSTASAVDMAVNTPRSKMTSGRAALLMVLDTYRKLNYGLSKIEVQKLAYFLQEAGENLNLQFVKHQYGPYAETLRHALKKMDGHFIRGLGDKSIESEIAPIEAALAEAELFIQQNRKKELLDYISRVAELIEGFQSPYGMELLSTVHWVAKRENANNPEEAILAVQSWSERKRHLMTPEHIKIAWCHLVEYGWIQNM